MQVKRLLILLGLALAIVAAVWWGLFYGGAADRMGASVSDFLQETLPCLIYSTDVCALVRGFGNLLGYSPYQPVMLWVAIALVIVGIVLPRGRAGEA